MKTICIIHGVGFGGAEKSERHFGNLLKNKLPDVNIVYFEWDHPGAKIEHFKKIHWPYQNLRNYINEVIMDFAHIVRNLDKLVANAPPADFYIGHSGGTVIANEFKNHPRVLLASPAQLVENVKISSANLPLVLNLMHPYDVIAAPVTGALNKYVSFGGKYPFVNLWNAHVGYWYSKAVLDEVIFWFKAHV